MIEKQTLLLLSDVTGNNDDTDCVTNHLRTNIGNCEMVQCDIDGASSCGFVDHSQGPFRWISTPGAIRVHFAKSVQTGLQLEFDKMTQTSAYLHSPILNVPTGMALEVGLQFNTSYMSVSILILNATVERPTARHWRFAARQLNSNKTTLIALPEGRIYMVIQASRAVLNTEGSVNIVHLALSNKGTCCVHEQKSFGIITNSNNITRGEMMVHTFAHIANFNMRKHQGEWAIVITVTEYDVVSLDLVILPLRLRCVAYAMLYQCTMGLTLL